MVGVSHFVTGRIPPKRRASPKRFEIGSPEFYRLAMERGERELLKVSTVWSRKMTFSENPPLQDAAGFSESEVNAAVFGTRDRA